MDKKVETWDEVYKAILGDKQVEIAVMYHDAEYGKRPRLQKFTYGDWIDLYTAEDVTLSKGEFTLISLGVSMQLPKGYEAIVASRSSTYVRYGIIMTNSIGIIDNTYCGENDIWRFPAYALEPTTIPKDTRICQFRIQKNHPQITFNEVERLECESRGGFGSTGV